MFTLFNIDFPGPFDLWTQRWSGSKTKYSFFCIFERNLRVQNCWYLKLWFICVRGNFGSKGLSGPIFPPPLPPQSCTDTHKSSTFCTVIEAFDPFYLVSLQNRVDPALLYHLPINFRECNENEVQLYNKILERHACDYVNWVKYKSNRRLNFFMNKLWLSTEKDALIQKISKLIFQILFFKVRN